MLLKSLRLIPWLLMLSLAVLLGGMSMRYFSFRPDINFLRVKQFVVHEIIWRTAFYVHISGGIVAIVTVPLQFLMRSRQGNAKLHRTLGKVYLGAILFVGAPAGFYMALYANGGPWASTGFAVMSMLWFYTTLTAYQSARNRKFKEHSQWMVRSYALTFSAITLRLWVPLCSIYFHMEPGLVVTLSAWVSWGFNLIFAEFLLLLDRRLRLRIAY